MRRLFVASTFTFVAVFITAQTPALAGTSSFEWLRGPLPALSQSIRFTEHGRERPGGGCEFTWTNESPPGVSRWLVRQIAVDFRRCVAITEAGVPGPDFQVPSGGSNVRVSKSGSASSGSGQMTAGGRLARPLFSMSVGYTDYWYANVFNQPLTKTHVDISWNWNGSCVTSTTGGGTFTWWSDWAYDYNGTWSSDYYCVQPGLSYGTVRVYGTFHGTINPSCYHRYWPATAEGNHLGAIDYGPFQVSANCSGGYLHIYKFTTTGG